MLDEFRAVVEGLTYNPPPCRSSPTSAVSLPVRRSRPRSIGCGTPARAVRFADGIRALDALGVVRQIEIGPGGTLTALARTITDTPVAPTLRARRPEPEAFADVIAHAQLTGLEPDWHALHPGARRVELPTYAFERERYWLSSAGTGNVEGAGLLAVGHPLLGAAVAVAGKDEWLLTGRLSLAAHPWIADHKVFDTVLVPGTALVELALAAGERTGCPAVSELTLQAPLVIPSAGDVEVQVSVGEPDDEGLRSIEIHARAAEADWVQHAVGVLTPDADVDDIPPELWPPAGAEPLETAGLYDRLAELGFGYGPAFQGATAAWRRGDAVYAEVALDERQGDDAARYGVHPALFDAGFHAAIDPEHLALPFSFTGVRLERSGASALRVSIVPSAEGTLTLRRPTPSAPRCSPWTRSRRGRSTPPSSVRPGHAPAVRARLDRDRGGAGRGADRRARRDRPRPGAPSGGTLPMIPRWAGRGRGRSDDRPGGAARGGPRRARARA